MQDDLDDPAARCPGPCDGVIPVVYPDQPITVPYDAIRGEMSLLQRAAIDEEESVRRTFSRPDADPPLSIASANSSGVRVLGLGHAGVAYFNGLTGQVACSEYGRYGGNYGAVRSATMPTLTFGADDNPDRASFEALARALTRKNGGPYGVDAVVVKLLNGSFDVMQDFADRRRAEVQARSAAAYDVKGNHCFTYALEVAASAGVNANVSAAEDLEIILVASLGGFRIDAPAGNAIELPSRQMRHLQTRYRPLTVSAAGGVPGDFEFPAGPYAR